MLWSWAAALLVAVAIATPPSIHWEYAPPWQPLDKSCASCQQTAGSSRQPRTIRPSFSHEDLMPGEERKLNPTGRTTIVKMAMENVATTDNNTVQLVFIPEGRLLSLADRGLARMLTAESKTYSSVIPAPTLAPQQSSDKQKRDHRGQVVTGGPNVNSFPMTLVAAEGKENTAKEQLQLLEAALSSHQTTKTKNGQLPRVFIAPSNIPPPPGYVKIPLVPQRQAELRENLPPTFLTHSNPNPLPPGFVRLSLPPSVSHLSKDIPLVESQRLHGTISSNFVTESPFKENEVSVSQKNNGARRPPPPPPIFDNREKQEQPLQELVNDKREATPQTFSQIRPNRINNEIIPNRFPNSGSPLPKTVSQKFADQGSSHFSPQQNRGLSNENNLGVLRNDNIRNSNNNRQQGSSTFNNGRPVESPQNFGLSDQRNERLPQRFPANVPQQHQIKKSPPPLVTNTNIPLGKFEQQRRLQEFNRNQNFPSQNLNFNNQAAIQRPLSTNFPVPRPNNNRGNSHRATERPFAPPRPSAESTFFTSQDAPTSRFPSSPNAPRQKHPNHAAQAFFNQNTAHPSLGSGSRRQPSPSLIPGAQDSREFNRKPPSKQSFVPLPNAVNQEQIEQIVRESDLGRIEASSSRPFISNSRGTSFENDRKKVNHRENTFGSSPKIGIQVVSKGEPKTQERTSSTPRPVAINTSNFPPNVPSRASVQSTTRRPQFSARPTTVHPSSNILPIIGTPANIPFRERNKEIGSISRVPSASNSQLQNKNIHRNPQKDFPNNQRTGNFGRVNQREPVSPTPSIRQNSDFSVEGNVQTSSQHGGFLSSTELGQNNRGGSSQLQNVQPKPLASFEQRETENSRPHPVRLQTNVPVSQEQNFVQNGGIQNIPSRASFENHSGRNRIPASATPRITTFSPFSVTPSQSTFSTTGPTLRRTTFAPHVTTFSPPRFFQSSPLPIPNIIDNSVINENTPSSRERSSFSSLHTPRPFISTSGSPLLSSPRPHIPTTPRPEIISTFSSFPSTEPTFSQSSTTDLPPFTSTLHPNFETTERPFISNTETPFVDLDNVGPFRVQPFFNSFALPQPIRTELRRENIPTTRFSLQSNQNLNENIPFRSNPSPSPVNLRNTQFEFENSSPRTQQASEENFATTISSIVSSTDRPFALSNEVRPHKNVRRPSQRFPSRNRVQIQRQPERVIPSPQKIDVPQERVRTGSTTAQSITPLPDTTEINKISAVKVTTFKPKFKFSFTKPTEKSVSVTESPVIQATRESATTLFPPFLEARRRQRVNKKKEADVEVETDVKVEAKVQEVTTTRKTQPFIFGRRIRPRPQQRGEADQTSSGSNTRVSNTVRTAQPNSANTRLRVSGRKRIRGRFRTTTTSTPASVSTVEEDEVKVNLEESTATPNEVQAVETPEVKTGRRGSAVFKTRRQPTSGTTEPQRRQRPGTRRVPQWLRERRRRLRSKLNATTTEQPVLDPIIDDPPIDFIDDNAFAAAESARVTFTQPSENDPRQDENSNAALNHESTEPSSVIVEITTLEEVDQGTETPELIQIEDATEVLVEDSFNNDEASVVIPFTSATTEETPLRESELDSSADDGISGERQDTKRAALTRTRSGIPEQSRENIRNQHRQDSRRARLHGLPAV